MRNIPTVTKNLLIINVLAYLVGMVFGIHSGGFNDLFGLHFFLAPDFGLYQLVTYMFMHASLSHLFFNMFALWMFGCIVERTWGARKFLFYYMACGIGAGLLQEMAQFVQFYMLAAENIHGFSVSQIMTVAKASAVGINLWTTVGASGAIYGILLAFGMLYPEERMFIFPLPVPIKAKFFVVGYAAIELFMAFSTSGDGVAHLAHLGGMLFGFLLIRYWHRHPGRGYNRVGGRQFFDSMRSSWEQRTHRKADTTNSFGHTSTRSNGERNPDWDYNARRRASQEEIDRILDKIRRNGYDSLTRDEKQTLFDASNNK